MPNEPSRRHDLAATLQAFKQIGWTKIAALLDKP